MKPSVIPPELKGKALFDFLVKNEGLISHAKKSMLKTADGIIVPRYFVDDKGQITSKAMTDMPEIPETATKLRIDTVINTTGIFDSHYDVHIPGLWNKSLSDNKGTGFYLLDTHGRHFEDVIGEKMQGAAKKLAWKDLGFSFTGITEALMFSGEIQKERNPFMFGQYAKGYVKQHSVGMRYVKLVTCINDDDYPVQKENWDKYISMVVNRDDAEEEGFFWAILEAKVVEGSAVLFGSNSMTPTHNTMEVKEDTPNEPPLSTQDEPFDISKALQKTTFII